MTDQSETAPTHTPWSSFQKATVALVAALFVVVAIVGISLAVGARNAAVEEAKRACDVYPIGSVDYFYCVAQAEK